MTPRRAAPSAHDVCKVALFNHTFRIAHEKRGHDNVHTCFRYAMHIGAVTDVVLENAIRKANARKVGL